MRGGITSVITVVAIVLRATNGPATSKHRFPLEHRS